MPLYFIQTVNTLRVKLGKHNIPRATDSIKWLVLSLVYTMLIRGFSCQRQVFQAGISNCIPRNTVGHNHLSLLGIPWYLLLAPKSSYVILLWLSSATLKKTPIKFQCANTIIWSRAQVDMSYLHHGLLPDIDQFQIHCNMRTFHTNHSRNLSQPLTPKRNYIAYPTSPDKRFWWLNAAEKISNNILVSCWFHKNQLM